MNQYKLVQFERYASSLVSEFFWQLQNVVEVMRGRSTHQLSFAEDKVSTTLSLLQNAGVLGSAVSIVGSVGLGLVGKRVENKRSDLLTPEILSGSWTELQKMIQVAAREAVERYQHFLSKCSESDAVELGRVSAQRIWEYIPRKRLTFTLDNLLRGIYKGKSGRWQEDWRNNKLTGASSDALAAKEKSRQTAEGALSHGGMAFWSEVSNSFEYFLHPRDKSGMQAKYGFMLIKSEAFKGNLLEKEKYQVMDRAPSESTSLETMWQSGVTLPGKENSSPTLPNDITEQLKSLEADWCSFSEWQASAEALLSKLSAQVAEHGVAISSLQSSVSSVANRQGELHEAVVSVKSAQDIQDSNYRYVASTVAELSGRKKNTYIPSPYQQSRPQLWAELEGYLLHVDESHVPIVLVGGGGMGKSSIANMWLKKQKSAGKYDSIRNLPMDASSIDASLQELAADLGISTLRRLRREWLVDVSRAMKAQKWLMVWDNVDSAANVAEIYPHFESVNGYQQLMITTRDQVGWGPSRAAVVSVDVFTPTESVEYIQYQMKAAFSPHFDKVLAEELSAVLGYHPLSLELAMGAICLQQSTLQQYLLKLSNAGSAGLSASNHKLSFQGRVNSATTLRSLWSMSIESLSDGAVDLLKLLSFMSPFGFSKELSLPLFDYPDDEDAFEDAFLELRQRSLVQAQDGGIGAGNHWKIHRLLQEVVRNEALKSWADTEVKLARAIEVLKELYKEHSTAASNETVKLQRAREGLFHFNAFLEHLPHISKHISANTSKQWSVYLMSSVASIELQLSLLSGAEKHFIAAYRMSKNDIHKDVAEFANICHSIGVLYQSLRDLEKAREFLNESLESLYTLHGRAACNDSIAKVLNSLGNSHMTSGDFDKAYEYLSQSMDMFGVLAAKYQTKSYQMGLAIEIASVGYCLLQRKMYDEAESNFQAALTILEKFYPNGHPEISNVYSHMSALCDAKGDASAALRFCKKALEVDREVYGDANHQSVAIALHNLAHTYAKQKDFSAAQMYFKKALSMKRIVFKNKPHFSIVETLSQLGDAHKLDHNDAEAEKNYVEALEMLDLLESIPSQDSAVSFVHLLNALGELFIRKGNFSEANLCLLRALRISGSNNEVLYPTLTNLVALARAQDDVVNCIKFSELLLELMKKYVDPTSNAVTTAMYELGRLYIRAQDGPKAVTILMETKTILDKKFFNSPDLDTHYALAHLHYRLGEAFSLIGDGTNTLGAYNTALGMYEHYHAQKGIVHHLDMAMTYLAIGILYLKSDGAFTQAQAIEMIQKSYLEYCHINIGFICQADINAIIGLLGRLGAKVPDFVPGSVTDFGQVQRGKNGTGENEEDTSSAFNCCVTLVCCPCVCVGVVYMMIFGGESSVEKEKPTEDLEMSLSSASESTKSPMAIQR